jgi:hypothetical protein
MPAKSLPPGRSWVQSTADIANATESKSTATSPETASRCHLPAARHWQIERPRSGELSPAGLGRIADHPVRPLRSPAAVKPVDHSLAYREATYTVALSRILLSYLHRVRQAA